VLPLITNLIAGFLTLCVLSRILGDNPLFRLAQYLFVGVSLGFSFVVLYHQVLAPAATQIAANLDTPAQVGWLAMPFVLWLLFIPRMTRRQAGSWLANIPLALIFGVGVALSFVGALAGTLIPQVLTTVPVGGSGLVRIVGGIVLALGVIVTLSYFYFTAPHDTARGRLVAFGARVGRWWLMVAFGFFFAGALVTYLTALSERFEFLLGR
jgi:hypothetical protein